MWNNLCMHIYMYSPHGHMETASMPTIKQNNTYEITFLKSTLICWTLTTQNVYMDPDNQPPVV